MANKPELLAPAGGMDALKAAVQSGADAVYLGTKGFNARQGAENFDAQQLSEAVRYCHLRDVQVHVTLNTIVHPNEAETLKAAIREIADSGADAVIVQDLGVARLVRSLAPGLHLHASTQMAVHNRAGVAFLAEHGFSRVVLAREMRLEEIRACAAEGVETEVFVHGALCVSCSGQCLFSSMVGGRSANRGRCAQPCRLPYTLEEARGYLLSPRDLCLLSDLDALTEAGVTSYKIEGRLKSPAYVGAVVSAYRRALDDRSAPRDTTPLLQAFNRGGFSRGYVFGVREKELMFPEDPGHQGLEVGFAPARDTIRLTRDVTSADSLAIAGRKEEHPLHLSGRTGEDIALRGIRKGDRLVRMVSDAQQRAAEELLRGEHRQIALTGSLEGRVGERARLTISDGTHSVEVLSPAPLEEARTPAENAERARAQLEKTGGTPYRFASLSLDLDLIAFCPASLLNGLRREALAQMDQARLARPAPIAPAACEEAPWPKRSARTAELHVESDSAALLAEAAVLGAERVLYRPSDLRMEALSAAARALPDRFSLVLPMVLTDDDLCVLNAWARSLEGRIESTYLTNIGQLGLAWPGKRVADWPLNIANPAALAQLAAWGLDEYVPSVELTAAQIRLLPAPDELVVYGRLPLMQLRHCPVRAARGLSGDHDACCACDTPSGMPSTDQVCLRDRRNVAFPLRRIRGTRDCTVQVLNSVPLMLLRRAAELPRAAAWRLIATEEDDIDLLLKLHREALGGRDPRDMAEAAGLLEREHTTGHYFRGVDR